MASIARLSSSTDRPRTSSSSASPRTFSELSRNHPGTFPSPTPLGGVTYRSFVHGEPDGGFAELTFCVVRSDSQVRAARRPALLSPLSSVCCFRSPALLLLRLPHSARCSLRP